MTIYQQLKDAGLLDQFAELFENIAADDRLFKSAATMFAKARDAFVAEGFTQAEAVQLIATVRAQTGKS